MSEPIIFKMTYDRLRQRSLLYNTPLSQSRERGVTIETDAMFICQIVAMITRSETLLTDHFYEG